MEVTVDALLEASRRQATVARSLSEARTVGAKTVFLCHSHADQQLVRGLIKLLEEAGWRPYVDWNDSTMPAAPSRATATGIQDRIKSHDLFLYLATRDSSSSRWCPWEIGYANGVKNIERLVVCAVRDGAALHGAEYLELYRRIELDSMKKAVFFEAGARQTSRALSSL